METNAPIHRRLTRGRSLFLNANRYERLRGMWLDHLIPAETIASTRYIAPNRWAQL